MFHLFFILWLTYASSPAVIENNFDRAETKADIQQSFDCPFCEDTEPRPAPTPWGELR